MNHLNKEKDGHNDFSKNKKELKIFYLEAIANILSSIDHNKNEGGGEIAFLSLLGMEWVDEMLSNNLDVGMLPSLFNNINFLIFDSDALTLLIEDAHEEVANLLGDDEALVYSPL